MSFPTLRLILLSQTLLGIPPLVRSPILARTMKMYLPRELSCGTVSTATWRHGVHDSRSLAVWRFVWPCHLRTFLISCQPASTADVQVQSEKVDRCDDVLADREHSNRMRSRVRTDANLQSPALGKASVRIFKGVRVGLLHDCLDRDASLEKEPRKQRRLKFPAGFTGELGLNSWLPPPRNHRRRRNKSRDLQLRRRQQGHFDPIARRKSGRLRLR